MHICAVKAFALFAVFVAFGATAVASIPSAASVVVRIITCVVTFPGWLATAAFDFRHAFVTRWFEFAIQALAYFAELELVVLAADTTTIPVVPGTPSIVVAVVAEAISNELLGTANSLDCLSALISFVLKSAIQALTFLAVLVVFFVTAAIASIPIATSIIVIVVASAVSLPKRLRAL